MKTLITYALFALIATAVCVLFLVRYMVGGYFSFIPMVIFGVLALVLWIEFNQQLKQYFGEKNTQKFTAMGAPGKELVDLVRNVPNAAAVIHNYKFYKDGLKLVIMGFSNRTKGNGYDMPLIVTKDCIYERDIYAYSIPRDANISFTCGSEIEVVRHQKMDVGKSASVGYMAGGLGAAIHNASKAAEINANGGLAYSYGIGKYPVQLSSGGMYTDIRYLILSNTVLEAFSDAEKDAYIGDICERGTYFTLLRLDTYNRPSSTQIANNLTKLLHTAISQ